MNRRRSEFDLYDKLFRAMDDGMREVSERVAKREEERREAQEKMRIAITGKRSAGLRGSSE